MEYSRVFKMSFASVYPHYISKAEKKGKTKQELDTIIFWLIGFDKEALEKKITNRVEDIENELMQQIRYLDKLIDELARDKKMKSILR